MKTEHFNADLPDRIATGVSSGTSTSTTIDNLDDIGDVDVPSPTDGEVLTWDDYLGLWVAAPGTGSSLEVKETDGTPDVDPTTIIEVPPGGLTDNGGGDVTLEYLQRINGGLDVVFAHGSMGVTETFNAADGNWHTGTFTANCTFTLTNPLAGGAWLILELAQDGTGGWTVTLPASVTNRVALEAAQVTTLSTTAFLILWTRDQGTTWYGQWQGSGAAVAFATPAVVLGSSAAAGAASTVIRSDSTIQAFDATAPVTQAFSDTAATGSVAYAARRDHRHGMPSTDDVRDAGRWEHAVITGSPPEDLYADGDWLYIWVT